MKNNFRDIVNRKKNIFNFILTIFMLITVRYFYIQVIRGDFFKEESGETSTRIIETKPPRGFILDRNGKVIVSNRSTFSILMYPIHYNDSLFDHDLFFNIINKANKRSVFLIKENHFIDSLKKSKKYRTKKYKPIRIVNYIDFETKAKLMEHKIQFPGLFFNTNPARFYPKDLRLAHVLGYLRPIPIDKVGIDGYNYGDSWGRDGIESKFEALLRGNKGREHRLVDVKGIDYGIDTEKENFDSKVGSDVQLTIDYGLQLKIESLLKGYNGSIICMNPENGEVLAMASSPDYSLKEFIGPLKYEVWDQWKKDKRLLNRATAGQYEPGSLYKLVSFIMFMQERKVPIDTKVFCNGKYELEDQSNPGNPQIHRCWKKDGHGEVDLHDAIMKSCNIYFYDMILKYQEQDKYIIDVLHKYAEELGFNKKTGIEIFEQEGRIPDSDWMVKNKGKRWPKRGSMPNLIIGQGDNAITPLQGINLINLIAMEGKAFKPKLILNNPSIPFNSSINQYVWIKLKEAIYSVVNNNDGTAFNLKNDTFIIRGKTGTAQMTSNTSEENLISWFGGYVEGQDNLMSLLVMIEDTNSDTKGIAKALSKNIVDFQLSRGNNE
ncbi:MAG: hypothetical protein CMG21_02320 [Candidatus Marinimicrobia bacterium]|nr:hypothetical protein [Candidatus Neomarinimicrobiota bacterium]